MSKNVVTLTSGSEVTQGHWKWYHSVEAPTPPGQAGTLIWYSPRNWGKHHFSPIPFRGLFWLF